MNSVLSPLRLALVAIGAPLLVLGCTAQEPQQQPNDVTAANHVRPEPAEVAKPRAPLDREDLIVAVLKAATAAALGQNDSAAQAELKGNRFELRMRFGCSEGDSQAAGGWTYEEKNRVLRARVRADLDTEQVNIGGLARDYQGAVGFTLQRPWIMAEGCPDPRFAEMGGGPAITIAQLFTGSDSRVQRPEASYQTVTPTEPQEVPSQGLTLVLSGRLEPLADGRPIQCAAAKGPPACIVSVLIDRVAIEDPARKIVLGEWGPG